MLQVQKSATRTTESISRLNEQAVAFITGMPSGQPRAHRDLRLISQPLVLSCDLPAVGTCYESDGTPEQRRDYCRPLYRELLGERQRSIKRRHAGQQRRRFYGMVPKRDDYLQSPSYLGPNVRETPRRSQEIVILDCAPVEGRGGYVNGADCDAFIRKARVMDVIPPDTENVRLEAYRDDFVLRSGRTVYEWVCPCPDIPLVCGTCSRALDRLVAATADCWDALERAVPFVWPTEHYVFAASRYCPPRGRRKPYVWPKDRPYVFAGSPAGKDDDNSRLDIRLIPAWIRDPEITDPAIRDLHWYAVTLALRRNMADLQEAISIANEAVVDAWLTYSPECSGGASHSAWLKKTVRNAIDAWSRRKANQPKRGADYDANQRLNGFVPPSDQPNRERAALHYHEHEARPGHVPGDPLSRVPRRPGKRTKPWRDRYITLDCTECKQPCLTLQGADPDRYTCDTCLAGLGRFALLWHDPIISRMKLGPKEPENRATHSTFRGLT
jgi:hypothetical protein